MNITTYKGDAECGVYASWLDGRVVLTLWETWRARPFGYPPGKADAYLTPAQARIVAGALVEYANALDRSQEKEAKNER